MNSEFRFSGALLPSKTHFEGYAARWHDPADGGTEYRLSENLVERIKPGAFKRSLESGKDVRALYNHDSSAVLGRTKAGTLTLVEDGKGLRFSIPFDSNDPDHVKAMAKVSNKSVAGASFEFTVRSQGQKFERGVRYLTDIDLKEITICGNPAYESTSVEARSKDVEQQYANWIKTQEILERIERLKP